MRARASLWTDGDERVEALMRRAIAEAAPTRPHPNPRVGAVLTDRDGSIVATGSHEGPGRPHAEVVALDAAGPQAAGATMFVTLEPCVHHGRTPPCTEALITADVARVIVGMPDPDSRVAGKGIAALRAAGIDVRCGVLADEVEAMDRGYFHHRRTGRPLVTLKAAATLDGQVAASDGTSKWITSPEARRDGHRLRAAADAVLVGAGTLLADDPRLTVRLDGYSGDQPVPVVIAGERPLPPDAALFSRKALVYTTTQLDVPAEVITVSGTGSRVDLVSVLEDLGARGHLDVLVEGGPALASGFLVEGLADRVVLYLGSLIAGGSGRGMFDRVFATLGDARAVTITDVATVGPDVRIACTIEEAP